MVFCFVLQQPTCPLSNTFSMKKWKKEHIRTKWVKCCCILNKPHSPCFRAPSWDGGELMECNWRPLKNTSPFNNVATLSVFGLKTHTHSQMLSVHTTKFCGQLFQELVGKVSMPQILEVALTLPPCFQMTHFTFSCHHWQCPFSAEVQCSHKCYRTVVFKQNHCCHCA